jgi:nicotinate phosphoribosyltransferase
MSGASAWVTDETVALLLDQYQLTMAQAYWRERMFDEAGFSLFVRRLPPERNYLVACGLSDALDFLERFHFSADVISWLARFSQFSPSFLEWLAQVRFTGDVYAPLEGTPLFPNEPLLEVVAPLPEAQLVETMLLNLVNFQTIMASKASRVVTAAAGRTVVDFGLRRAHGTDAGVRAVRAFYLAGVHATSNMLAGRIYGIPVAGTMGHSYIQAHEREFDAFRQFATLYPDTTLLVDTYDTLAGVEQVIRLAQELGPAFRVRAVRLDSGDLAGLARAARERLDRAGLTGVEIFASVGLNEHEIAAMIQQGVPVDGFGVGTDLAVSRDAPGLDIVYKLTVYGGRGRLKLSSGKAILPGRKQVFRMDAAGETQGDVLAREGELLPGRPLLQRVMHRGRRTGPTETLEAARARAAAELAALPEPIRHLVPAAPPYPVQVSQNLQAYAREVAVRATHG